MTKYIDNENDLHYQFYLGKLSNQSIMVDRIYRTRSLGVALSGLPDQYADGKAAKVWELYLGSKQERTSTYKEWFINLLKSREVSNVLDVACGTGVDSVMLLEEGFNIISTDASDKMLKVALNERWNRRKEPFFDNWIIEEANWLTLPQDLKSLLTSKAFPKNGFDAVICLGNSFAHLPDLIGDQSEQKLALSNMRELLKPGGILVIDHRNYDYILRTGHAPKGKNVYYPSDHIKKIRTSNLYVDGKPTMITLDYTMDITAIMTEQQLFKLPTLSEEEQYELKYQHFRLSYYPHTLEGFTTLLKEVFGDKQHDIYGDFKELKEIIDPAYFIHVLTK